MNGDKTRAGLLDAVRAKVGDRPGRLTQAELDTRLQRRPRHRVPARSQLAPAERLALFIEMAETAAASVQRVSGRERVPQAVAEYVLRHNLPSELAVAPDLAGLDWQQQPRLKVDYRAGRDGDRVSVTPALAGVAETGTLLLASGAGCPSTLNFLPDCHIVVIDAAAVVGPYEDAFDGLRAHGFPLPRTVNLITGPSRSADIEQTLQLGAHGPVQLHIIVVESAATGESQR